MFDCSVTHIECCVCFVFSFCCSNYIFYLLCNKVIQNISHSLFSVYIKHSQLLPYLTCVPLSRFICNVGVPGALDTVLVSQCISWVDVRHKYGTVGTRITLGAQSKHVQALTFKLFMEPVAVTGLECKPF